MGVHKSTASRIVRKVSHKLALLRPTFINFPETQDEMNSVKQEFCNTANFPKCIGAIHCSHIRITVNQGNMARREEYGLVVAILVIRLIAILRRTIYGIDLYMFEENSVYYPCSIPICLHFLIRKKVKCMNFVPA